MTELLADSPFRQTPLYRALRSDRYDRQDQIRKIQDMTKRRLLVYEQDTSVGSGAFVSNDDIPPFCDLLQHVQDHSSIDLMVNSAGGVLDAADKIAQMCWDCAQSLRVIVPEWAKSAATFLALASEEVVMGITSELGPIDPQFPITDPAGRTHYVSAQSIIDDFDEAKAATTGSGALPPAYYPILQQLYPGLLKQCRNARKRSEQLATEWLKKHMLPGPQDAGKAENIAKRLSDTNEWLSHGVVIDAKRASDDLEIKVLRLSKNDPLWERIWYLHCCYRTLFKKTHLMGIFESEEVSLPMAGR